MDAGVSLFTSQCIAHRGHPRDDGGGVEGKLSFGAGILGERRKEERGRRGEGGSAGEKGRSFEEHKASLAHKRSMIHTSCCSMVWSRRTGWRRT